MKKATVQKRWRIFGLLALMACFFCATANANDNKEEALPSHRFASLKAAEVNMRVGPGTRYTIKWVYKEEGLPVEIIEEFDAWRKIRDCDGTVGWVHKQMLQGKRTAVIWKSIGVLRKSADEHGQPVIRVEPGVVGKLLGCETDWCKIQIAGHKGWIAKTGIWGVYKDEKF